jgi:phage repressor protein C with HTH and peptisase S24 domain
MGIGKNIERAMVAASLRPVDIARALGISDSAVSQWFAKDKGPSTDRLPQLARLLKTTVDDLIGNDQNQGADRQKREVRPAGKEVTLPDNSEMPYTVPVYGTALGGAAGDVSFILNGDTGVKVRRPPKYKDREDIFALYVQGDSMSPRFKTGELIYLEKHRPPQNGDYVVVELYPDADGIQEAYLKQLVATTPTKVKLQQLNPEKIIEIERERVLQVVRVMTLMDLLG